MNNHLLWKKKKKKSGKSFFPTPVSSLSPAIIFMYVTCREEFGMVLTLWGVEYIHKCSGEYLSPFLKLRRKELSTVIPYNVHSYCMFIIHYWASHLFFYKRSCIDRLHSCDFWMRFLMPAALLRHYWSLYKKHAHAFLCPPPLSSSHFYFCLHA